MQAAYDPATDAEPVKRHRNDRRTDAEQKTSSGHASMTRINSFTRLLMHPDRSQCISSRQT
uniref:Uncharacterized protein n=1 Tax=Arundo donax TaxID=35708 RepID=A0A0A9AJR1_ARUDO